MEVKLGNIFNNISLHSHIEEINITSNIEKGIKYAYFIFGVISLILIFCIAKTLTSTAYILVILSMGGPLILSFAFLLFGFLINKTIKYIKIILIGSIIGVIYSNLVLMACIYGLGYQSDLPVLPLFSLFILYFVVTMLTIYWYAKGYISSFQAYKKEKTTGSTNFNTTIITFLAIGFFILFVIILLIPNIDSSLILLYFPVVIFIAFIWIIYTRRKIKKQNKTGSEQDQLAEIKDLLKENKEVKEVERKRLEQKQFDEIKQLLKEQNELSVIKAKIKEWKNQGYNVDELEKMIKELV